MLASGFYKHPNGVVYNIIGVSENTEGGEKSVVLQEFPRAQHTTVGKGRICHIGLVEFERDWVGALRLVKPLNPPRMYCTPPNTPDWLPPGLYQHFKGGKYNCIGVSAPVGGAGELVMVYQSLYGNRIFQLAHRPYDMFKEHVEKPEHSYSGPRFKLLRKYTAPTIAGTAMK